jgi:hypothetical protein
MCRLCSVRWLTRHPATLYLDLQRVRSSKPALPGVRCTTRSTVYWGRAMFPKGLRGGAEPAAGQSARPTAKVRLSTSDDRDERRAFVRVASACGPVVG